MYLSGGVLSECLLLVEVKVTQSTQRLELKWNVYVKVSFSEEHKKLPAGTYTVRFFDDTLYAELRKVWLL